MDEGIVELTVHWAKIRKKMHFNEKKILNRALAPKGPRGLRKEENISKTC